MLHHGWVHWITICPGIPQLKHFVLTGLFGCDLLYGCCMADPWKLRDIESMVMFGSIFVCVASVVSVVKCLDLVMYASSCSCLMTFSTLTVESANVMVSSP